MRVKKADSDDDYFNDQRSSKLVPISFQDSSHHALSQSNIDQAYGDGKKTSPKKVILFQ